jgi:hypothetical protein
MADSIPYYYSIPGIDFGDFVPITRPKNTGSYRYLFGVMEIFL